MPAKIDTSSIKKLRDFARVVVDRAKQNVGAYRKIRGKQARRVSTGELKKSLAYKLQDNGRGKVNIKFYAKGPAGQYADVIEDGRRPNSTPPPVDAIRRWIEQKPLRLRDTKTGAFVKKTEAGVRSAAYLIARSIGKKGIVGIKYFEEALENEMEDRGEQYFTGIADEIVATITPDKRK